MIFIYPNLEQAMREGRVRKNDLARILCCDLKTVWNKLNGKTEFTISEALKIRDELFPGKSIEFLFSRGGETECES